MKTKAVRRYRRATGAPVNELSRHTVGNALVVHRGSGMSGPAKDLALSVAEDTEHDLVVVDLPADSPATVWGSVAAALPPGRRGVRLVVGGRARETTSLAGQWLADRLGRTVIAHDGAVVQAAGGALFVNSGRGSGWMRFEPGGVPRWEAKRFPRPFWDSAITELTPTSALGVAEPLPNGLWIRPVGADEPQREQRARLIGLSPQQNDILTVVLGSPGGPALSLDDVARIWVALPGRIRPHTRFVAYGPMAVPAGTSLGQALADLLGEEISLYSGLPVGTSEAPPVRAVLPDGTLGFTPFPRELGYQPHATSKVPALRSHREPLPGLRPVAPTVYWYAPDAVIEVVQSGLLVRPPADGPHTAAARAIALSATRNHVAFDGAGDVMLERMRGLAEDLAARLDHPVRQATRVTSAAELAGERATVRLAEPALARIDEPVQDTSESTVDDVFGEQEPTTVLMPPRPMTGRPTDVDGPAFVPPPRPVELVVAGPVEPPAAPEPAPVPVPSAASMPRIAITTVEPVAEPRPTTDLAIPLPTADTAVPPPTADTAVPQPTADAATPQPTPPSSAAALLPRDGIAEEREWLRRTLGHEHGIQANTVARILSEHPGLQGALARSSSDVLTDAVAVRLYLSAAGVAVDEGLRRAAVGPHVPLARCVVSGLGRLPSHRGPTTFAATVSAAQWAHLRDTPVLTEWGFVNALAGPCANLPGDTDVLIWSMTARRTRLLEAEPGGVPDRLLFVPGTHFRTMELVEPRAGERGRILLRELGAGEIDETGRLDVAPGAIDELALTSLRRELESWAAAPRPSRVALAEVARFGALPGLGKV